MFDKEKHKNIRVWKQDHLALKKQAAINDRQLIDEFASIMRSDVKVIDGKRYRVVPMESDSFISGKVSYAHVRRTNRVGKDG